jgi:hypothetical protein
VDGLDVLEYSSCIPCLPNAVLRASVTSLKIELGKFNILLITELPIKLFMYGGIGRMTSKRDGFARPSLAFIFDKNNCGEKDIRIFS